MFKEFEELLKSPKNISELVELEAAFGLIYPLSGRTYFTIFDHVDGYSWTLLADDLLESLYCESSANIGKKQESPGTCLLKSVKKIDSIQFYFDHIKPAFPTHSVTYFMSCLLCEGKDLNLQISLKTILKWSIRLFLELFNKKSEYETIFYHIVLSY